MCFNQTQAQFECWYILKAGHAVIKSSMRYDQQLGGPEVHGSLQLPLDMKKQKCHKKQYSTRFWLAEGFYLEWLDFHDVEHKSVT